MSRPYSTLEFNLVITRRYEYYTSQYYFALLVSQILALMLFGTEPTVGDRFENLIGLLLTIMALKFTMSDNIPHVPYDTLLDTFMNRSIYVLLVIGVSTFLLTIMVEMDLITEKTSEKVDVGPASYNTNTHRESSHPVRSHVRSGLVSS